MHHETPEPGPAAGAAAKPGPRGLEPWMTGSHAGVHPVLAALLYSFEHAQADLSEWTVGLSAEDLSAAPDGLAPVAFHVRHIAGSVDRLLTYARGEQLSDAQLTALQGEASGVASREELLRLLSDTLQNAARAVAAINPARLSETREIGRKRIPVPLGTLLVHIAEHTQRHVGEAIVTAKLLRFRAGR
jgi:hypothetical protein